MLEAKRSKMVVATGDVERGKLIVVDGIDGAGKTTLIDNLSKLFFAEHGISMVQLRSAGSTKIGEVIRDVLLNGVDDERAVPLTELALFYAQRRQLLEISIIPMLERGISIVMDRFNLSTLAYQGHAMAMIKECRQFTEIMLGDFEPDLELVLDLPYNMSVERVAQRNNGFDVIEQRGPSFFNKAREGFLTEADNSDKAHVLDAGQSEATVATLAIRHLERLYGVEPCAKSA